MSEMPLEMLIEATLFSSGKSMSVEELSNALGYDEDEMLDCLGSLQATLRRRKGGALQLAEIGERWALEVKPAIATHLPRETKTDMPPKLLKAAALIAYHQPMPQSRLVELLGQKAYDYVRELAQLGMIDRRKDGNTRRLATTRRFSEAFGCPHTDRKKVKAWFREQVQSSGLLDELGDRNQILKEEGEEVGTVQTSLPVGEEE
jgi:segregation and condensation protein B